MSIKTVLIVLFWGVIAFMLGRQLLNEFNQDSKASTAFHPPPNLQIPAPPSVAPSLDADVRQTHYHAVSISFTQYEATVTLKNFGQNTATGVQIFIRPYRGGPSSDNPGMDSEVPEDSPDSQFGQWLAFPDLAPGQEVTETMDFDKRDYARIEPGDNKDPKINFTSKK